MKHKFGKYWSCQCGCDTMILGCKKFDGKSWVTLEQIENDAIVRERIEKADKDFQQLVSHYDYTNITCNECHRRISKEEWTKTQHSIPKVSKEDWTIITEDILLLHDINTKE